MGHLTILKIFLLIVLLASSALSMAQTCKASFSVVWKDPLNNVKQGLSAEDLQWFEKKMAKKYPDVCYDPGAAPLAFFIVAKSSVYHGTTTESSTHSDPVEGTVTDEDGNRSTMHGTVNTTTDTTVPYSVNYQDMVLSIETSQPDGSWKVRHNFAHNTLGHALYGVKVSNRHPRQELLEQAIKWVHDGGLTDSKQSVLPTQ